MALSALSHYHISQPTPLPGQRAESSTQYDRRKFEHRSSPHIAKKHGDEEVCVATALAGRISPERGNQKITKAHTAERVAFALQAWGRDKSAPIARVQHIAGVDRKTAAAWYNGKSPPQSEHLLNLARAIPELKGEVRRLLHMDAELDPDFQREFARFMQMVAQR
jgi:hypothetical protein